MIGYGIVKGIPRLVLLVIVMFFLLLLWWFSIGYLYEMVLTGVHIPKGTINLKHFVQSNFWMILVITLYCTAILGTNYGVRKQILSLFRVPLLLILSSGLCIASAFIFDRSIPMLATEIPVTSTVELKPGTILVSGEQKELVLSPGEDSIAVISLIPPHNSLIDSIIQDGKEIGIQFESFWHKGLIPFIIFLAALLYLLTSLGPIFTISGWPLANLLIGLLLVRFTLWIQLFIFSEPVVTVISAIIGSVLPDPMHTYTVLVPLILLGTLIHFFAFLLYASKDRKDRKKLHG